MKLVMREEMSMTFLIINIIQAVYLTSWPFKIKRSTKYNLTNKKSQVILNFFTFIVDYLKKVLNSNEMSDLKLSIIKSLYDESIDFRSLNNLKKNLFESEKLIGNHIPMEEFIIQKDKILKDKMQKTEELLYKEIKVGDDRIDLIKFGELVDLFNYFPV